MELLVLASLWLIFLVLLFYAHTDTLRLLFLSAFSVLLGFPLVFAAILSWAFKDGLGPDSKPSEGWRVLGLFLLDISPVVLIVMGLASAGYFANRKALKRIESNRESQSSLLEL
jgi:hypothetical protein